MPFLDDTKINIALKKLLGKTHTDNAKGPSNEAIKSFVSIGVGTVFGRAVPTSPTTANLFDTTDGTVELVRLEAVPDPSANGHAFLLRLPANYTASSNNPNAGSGFFASSQYLHETAGKVQIVPDVFSLAYEAKPYVGGTNAKGSGSLVAPGDVRDWSLDYATGVLFQENNPDTSPVDIDYVECFIYIGEMADELLDAGGTASNFPIAEDGNAAVTGTELIDSVPFSEAKTIEWIINAQKGTTVYSCSVRATHDGVSASGFSKSNVIKLGSPVGTFFVPDVDVSGSNMRLNATTSDTDVVVDVTRVYVK